MCVFVCVSVCVFVCVCVCVVGLPLGPPSAGPPLFGPPPPHSPPPDLPTFRSFVPFPPTVSSFFALSGVFSWNCGPCSRPRTSQSVRLGPSGVILSHPSGPPPLWASALFLGLGPSSSGPLSPLRPPPWVELGLSRTWPKRKKDFGLSRNWPTWNTPVRNALGCKLKRHQLHHCSPHRCADTPTVCLELCG